ncbi:unnamed protein product [Amoebophrya sp. A25]|nr:unnamed protein product [Amoebophrya sp. A25]|eukprot:GSA25T00025710001.1
MHGEQENVGVLAYRLILTNRTSQHPDPAQHSGKL